MDHEAVATTLRRLALEAGSAVLDHYRSDEIAVRAKADATPVTEADLAANRIIVTGLHEAFPSIPVVTEEDPSTHRLSARQFFLVDPLDGTRDFVGRRGEFTVNIALIEDEAPTRGVVYAPAVGRLFYTRADGAAVEEQDFAGGAAPGSLTVLRVRQPDPSALVVVASKSHRNAATEAYIARYPIADSRAAGSSLKFCLLAAGEADLYPRLGRTMEWDTAAGQAVLAGAGGSVVRLDDLTPLSYGKAHFENPHFVAYVPGVPLAADRAA